MRRMSTLTFAVIALMSVGLSSCGAIWPPYRVWEAEQNGKAELAQADQNRQIQIVQSKAKSEAASFEATAEVTRANGVAQANKIIGDSLKGNDTYLHYLFINNMENTKNQVIYIPTEAGLPVLEAGHRPKPVE
jgi:regulator of protease activity HflC (stomatin/prohibitin superfamily)